MLATILLHLIYEWSYFKSFKNKMCVDQYHVCVCSSYYEAQCEQRVQCLIFDTVLIIYVPP